MWSVVIESPNTASARAPAMSVERRRGHGHALEIGRVLDVGGPGRPGIGVAAGDLDRPPAVVAVIDVGIAVAEHVGIDVRVDQRADLVVGRPDVLQDRPASPLLAVPIGSVSMSDADRALERIGDDQRRRGEIIGAAVGRHAALEIAVARQHRADDQILVGDRLGDRLGQRARIADAGRAAIADEVEADGVQILAEARSVEIVGDHLAARRERWS